MPEAKPTESPLQAVEEFYGRCESVLSDRPEYHHSSFSSQRIHDHMHIVRDQTDHKPQPKIHSINSMKETCNKKRNGNCSKQAVRKIIVVFVHIPEKDGRDNIQIRKHRKAGYQDHLEWKFPKLPAIRRHFILIVTVNGVSRAKVRYWGRHNSCNCSASAPCSLPSM